MLSIGDIAVGNIITGPTGELQVAGRIVTEQGLFVILSDPDNGLGAVVPEGHLIENSEFTLHTKQAPSGAASIEQTGASDAMRSELDRQSKLIDSLLAERSEAKSGSANESLSTTTVSTDATVPETVDPSESNPDPVVPTPEA